MRKSKSSIIIFCALICLLSCSNNGQRKNSSIKDSLKLSSSKGKYKEFKDYGCSIMGRSSFDTTINLDNQKIKVSIEAKCYKNKFISDTMNYYRADVGDFARIEKINDYYVAISISNDMIRKEYVITRDLFKDSINNSRLLNNGQFRMPFEIVSISSGNTITLVSDIHYPFSDAGISIKYELLTNGKVKIIKTNGIDEY